MRKGLWGLVAVLCGAALAGATYSAFSGLPALGPQDAGRWHPTRAETYTETWQFHVHADDGAFFFGAFLVSNAGLRDFNPGFNASYYEPDGQATTSELRIANNRLRAATDRFDVRIGDARMWQGETAYHMQIREGRVQANLTLQPTVPLWRVGTGRLVVGRSGESWNWQMPAPRGRVSGEVTVDGRTHAVRGRGFLDHAWSNLGYFRFSKNWLSLHVATPTQTINFHQIVKRPDRGGQTVRSLMRAVDGQPARVTEDVTLAINQWHQADRFRHPTAFTVQGVVDGAHIRLEATNGRYGEIIDPLATSSLLEQKIVRMLVTDPMVYRVVMDAKIAVTQDGQTTTENKTAVSNMLYFEL